jgi:hypothetical protein
VAEVRLTRAQRGSSVQEDWLAWLPEEKDLLFGSTRKELEVSYLILSVTLDDAFTLCQKGTLVPARQQAMVFADLFDRLAGRLHGVLRALNLHGRRFGTAPYVAPLCADFFRSERAQQVARGNNLRSLVSLHDRKRFFDKIRALGEVIAELQVQMRAIVSDIAEGTTLSMPEQWAHLEVLHYDLNTCLREVTIVLKSFFCVLPEEELMIFGNRLLSLVPAIAVRSRLPAPFLAKMGSACRQPAACRALTAVAGFADNPRLRPRHSRHKRDNSGSGERIPPSRMRPDGTGGPNETN